MGTRILTLGRIPPVDSQASYHAIARAVGDGQDDTVVLARPASPYACMGYHVSTSEVDLEYCRRIDIPVYRRRIGGGLVYLDPDQLFVQFCVGDLPRRPANAYPSLMDPLVDALDDLGLDGGLSPAFDLTANGRKIGGIGGGRIGGATAVTTNILFEFDWDRATRIHETPTPEFREQLRASMAEHITSLAGECPDPPGWEQVRGVVTERLEAAFPEPYHGTLTDREATLLAEERERLTDQSFLHLIDELRPDRRVKVRDGVFLRDLRGQLDGQPVRLVVEECEGRTRNVQLVEGEQTAAIDRLHGRPIDEIVATISDSTT